MNQNPNDLTSSENILPTEKTESLTSQLSEALEKASAPSPSEANVSKSGPSPAEGTQPDGEGERARDAFGRFAPKEGAATTPAAPGSPGEPDAPGATAAAGTGQDDPAAPPASWKAEFKEAWANVPEPLRPYLHQREKELQAGFQQVAQRAHVAESILGEFIPYAEVLQAEGATPVQAMRTLLQTAHALRTGGAEYKKSILFGLAQQYGVDLGAEINPQLAHTEAQLAQLATERMYGQATQQQQAEQYIANAFNAFANDPKNEFFPKVRGVMGQLIQNNMAADLPTAYNMALGMVPEVRQELMQRQINASTPKPKANLSVSGSPGGGGAVKEGPTPGGKGDGLREQLEKALGGG